MPCPGWPRSGRLPQPGCRTGRPAGAPAAAAPAGGPPGKTRRRSGSPEADPADPAARAGAQQGLGLQQRFPSGPRCKLAKRRFPLLAAGGEHTKAVERGVEPQKALQDTREQEEPSAGELTFVELDFHPAAPGKAHPILPHDARMVCRTSHALDPLNLRLGGSAIGEVVQAKQLLQRLSPTFYQRQIVQRQLGDQAPQLGLTQGRLDHVGGFYQRNDLPYWATSGQLEVAVRVSKWQSGGKIAVEAGEPRRDRV